jgi:hypothetical protein
MSDVDPSPSSPLLAWLADSPMFIDRDQVGAFYDAVVRPAFRPVQLQISKSRSEQLEKSFGARLGATLPVWFPWLKLDTGIEVGRDTVTGEQNEESITLEPVNNAERQLVGLTLHYLVNLPERVCLHDGGQSRLPEPAAILASPRMIAFIDAPPGAQFIPLAAELDNGRVVTFFEPLVDKLKRAGGRLPPQYPQDISTAESIRQRDAYWAWFSSEWNPNDVVQVMEDVIAAAGRPRWMDYRAVLGSGEILHLHMAGRGDYDTGAFAYNLVKRGWRHGIRIVGSLKSKPGLNILAIYEK